MIFIEKSFFKTQKGKNKQKKLSGGNVHKSCDGIDDFVSVTSRSGVQTLVKPLQIAMI